LHFTGLGFFAPQQDARLQLHKTGGSPEGIADLCPATLLPGPRSRETAVPFVPLFLAIPEIDVRRFEKLLHLGAGRQLKLISLSTGANRDAIFRFSSD
jgi:hypothetical protein